MDIQHLNIKFFLADPKVVNFADFMGIFNGWIQKQVTDELLIDVADYAHVPAGPGVLLIGHEANYSLDNTGHRPGLLYNRKAKVEGPIQTRLAQAAHAALAAARRLETEQGLKFAAQTTQLIINDRLLAPNTPETLATLAPELHAFFARLYAGAEYTLNWVSDPRERFTVNATTTANVDLAALWHNLESEAVYA